METTKTMSSTELLQHKALTVRLFRKKLPRNKLDKVLSAELSKLKDVQDTASLRVNKSLFTKAATESYMKVLSEAGKFYYLTTSPWDDKGFRLLSIEVYPDFTKKFKNYTRDFRAAVEGFMDSIEEDINLMKESLGSAFDRNDYNFLYRSNGELDREELRKAFVLELEYGTVADPNDIRANLTEDDRQIIADHITKKNTEKFAASQKHLIITLHEHIVKIHERLCESTNVFRDTLIGNLEDLCDLIPKMNIANDPALNKLAADAKTMLCKWDPQTIRTDDKVRAEVAAEADKILTNMKGMV